MPELTTLEYMDCLGEKLAGEGECAPLLADVHGVGRAGRPCAACAPGPPVPVQRVHCDQHGKCRGDRDLLGAFPAGMAGGGGA